MLFRSYSHMKLDAVTNEMEMIHRMGDVDYVEHSKFLIWNLDEGDNPGGTIIELAIAWYRGIPVYLITQVPKTHINKSLLYFVLDSGNGQGCILKNQKELLEFLDEKYNLKIIKSLENKEK